MTKHIPVRKNTTGNREQDAEEESSASEGERETVGKPTGKTPDTQNVRNVTETVMEKRMMEEMLRHAQGQSKYISTFSFILYVYHYPFTVHTSFQFFSEFFPIFLPIPFTSKACHFDTELLILLPFKCPGRHSHGHLG